MSLGSEENDWPTIRNRSPYYFMRRTWGFGTSLPTVWMVGGYFYITDSTTTYRGLWQNKQTIKNDPAIWEPIALHEESIAAMSLIFGDGPDEDGEMIL